jgi:soluble lytic murein transglycosylase-like protein
VWEWFKTNEHAKGLNKYRAAASYGLMQVLYATATDYGYATDPEYLFLPEGRARPGLPTSRRTRSLGQEATCTRHSRAYNGGKGNWDKPVPLHYADDVFHSYLSRIGA